MTEENVVVTDTEIEVKAEDLLYDNKEETNTDESDADSTGKETNSSEESESDKVANEGNKTGQGEEDKLEDSESKEIVYDLELGEKTFLAKGNVDAVVGFAKEHNLSNDAAKDILTKQDLAVADFVTRQEAAQVAETNAWAEEVKSDAELGGDNLTATIENSKSVLDRFGSDELTSMLRDSGNGNNPVVVRFLSKIGAAMAEDKSISSTRHGETSVSDADKFYGINN